MKTLCKSVLCLLIIAGPIQPLSAAAGERPCNCQTARCGRCGSSCPCQCPQDSSQSYRSSESDSAVATDSPQSQPRSSQQRQQSSLDFLSFGLSRGSYLTSSISPTGAGLGTATAMGTIGGLNVTNTIQNAVNPFISPGLLTSANAESPYATDRIFFNYSYYDSFQVTTPAVTTVQVGGVAEIRDASFRQTGFDLNRYDIGIEKTILGGVASIYVRGPFLDATNNIFNVPLDGPGNVNVGLKVQLFHDEQTGDILSTGFTVAAPTARPGRFSQAQGYDFSTPPLSTGSLGDTVTPQEPATIIEVNPTFLQPWIAAQINYDRLFIQGFLGVLVPTDDRVVTTFNPNVSVGWSLYESRCGDISSITPVINVQVLAPVHDNNALLDFSDQVFVTPGLQVGLGDRTSVHGGVTIPVAGPNGFDYGATVGINYLY